MTMATPPEVSRTRVASKIGAVLATFGEPPTCISAEQCS